MPHVIRFSCSSGNVNSPTASRWVVLNMWSWFLTSIASFQRKITKMPGNSCLEARRFTFTWSASMFVVSTIRSMRVVSINAVKGEADLELRIGYLTSLPIQALLMDGVSLSQQSASQRLWSCGSTISNSCSLAASHMTMHVTLSQYKLLYGETANGSLQL